MLFRSKVWYDKLSPRSIDSPIGLVNAFFQKYFPASAQHAALQIFFGFAQVEGEKLPESWARFCSLIRALPKLPLAKNELLVFQKLEKHSKPIFLLLPDFF